jgi:biotin carboxyl carrier protein
VRIGDSIWVHVDGRTHELRWQHAVDHHAALAAENEASVARAPMPGVVVRLMVAVGQEVASGDAMVIIESMKLETAIRAPRAGTVATVHVPLGQTFERDAPLVTLKEKADAAD